MINTRSQEQEQHDSEPTHRIDGPRHQQTAEQRNRIEVKQHPRRCTRNRRKCLTLRRLRKTKVFTAREREKKKKKKTGFASWRIAEVGSSGVSKWWEIWRERTSGSQGSLACTAWKTRKKMEMEMEMEGQEGHFASDDDADVVVVAAAVVIVVVRTNVVETEIGEEKRVGAVCDGEEDEWK
ncbi:hypothetical protein CMV_030537 [Castanea mollissima]|uniref:Uncharacterized protein n=1 Tax=Castanea mollissima TaxID=60419 RepID=A0A8J4Q545_9ROSI|nr:hypothetical protein CMV_030537 [Castanea mollissima]